MHITILTLFPSMLEAFLNESIIKRAQEKGLVTIHFVNPRDFAQDSHKSVDDRPYGGGAGMVMRVDVVHTALQSIVSGGQRPHIVLTSPRGTVFTQEKAKEYAQKEHIVLVCGHYEGMDERIAAYVDEEVSIGDFVLTGGEIPAAAITDAVIRLLPGVLKKEDASAVESFWEVPLTEVQKAVGEDELLSELAAKGVAALKLLEYPHYTRPETYGGHTVPEVLKSGNPQHIYAWRLREAYFLTKNRRKDLLIKG